MSNYGDYRDVEVLRKRGSELEAELARCEAEYHAQADRAENAERKRDEAKARAATAEAARLDADLQVARDQKRIAELERGRCEDCGATLTLDGCVLCGAPVCCPQCCQIQSLTDPTMRGATSA